MIHSLKTQIDRVRPRLASLLLALFLNGCIYRPLINFSSSDAPALAPVTSPVALRAQRVTVVPTKSVLPPPKLEVVPPVKRQLDLLSRNDSGYVAIALKRREQFHPDLVRIFTEEGLPLELLNLAIVESGFQAEARSPAGAVGMWQFMKSTARVYNLEVGFFRDQRKDPLLSTRAAALHLRDLFLAYRDWYLALAAYNAGSATVDNAVQRAGTTNFWKLCERGYLPRQTRDYVPKFIAVNLIVEELTGEPTHAPPEILMARLNPAATVKRTGLG